MKFKILTAILAAAIFSITDPTQAPLLLRLIISLASAIMLATVTALASEQVVITTTVLLSVSFFIGTIIDPEPSTYQVLLAFIACPIISAIAIKQGVKHDHQTLVESKKADKP